MTLTIQYEWDEEKRQSNLKKHGVDFSILHQAEWDYAITWEDDSQQYDEQRFRSLIPIVSRIYFLSYTLRGDNVRTISLRKADKSEIKYYVRQI